MFIHGIEYMPAKHKIVMCHICHPLKGGGTYWHTFTTILSIYARHILAPIGTYSKKWCSACSACVLVGKLQGTVQVQVGRKRSASGNVRKSCKRELVGG